VFRTEANFELYYIAEDKYLEILWLMGPHRYEDNSLKIVDILKEFSQGSRSPTSYVIPRKLS
jgi:hypothetical protein